MADGCFDLPVEDDFFLDLDLSVFTDDSASPFIGEIESLLMNDENHDQQNFPDLDHQSVSDFLEDLLVDYTSSDPPTDKVSDLTVVDSPTVGSDSDGIVTGKEAQGSNDYGKEAAELLVEKKSESPNDSGSESQDGGEIEGNDDAVAKKRRRRLRNRDAAVRSRERKKEYVKDLETKSKYLERECMRLGRILDCFAAENQSLRLCLQKGGNNNAPMTMQESAVLLLESLLLGSLLWYLGDIICQFPQPHTKSWFVQSVETDEPERLVQSGQGSSIPLKSKNWKSRRCKGSRPRMKQQVLTLVA
ncbi:unnamed protein product [Arabis nemorensis]|uniref:BZIP domain-containing protein n=1 Tax=Arabis nemorensis TaxID=586526 RepID=A0A565CQI6_9BRAS|nr:unnamed protein product [Arabis nemorensis]